MLLRLKNDTSTITLSGDGALVRGCTYVPRTPSISEQQVTSILRSGGEITALARRNVTESARVVLVGNATAILEQVRALEAMFPVDEAQRRASSGRMYVEFRIEDTGDVYRSEVLAGRVEWPDVPVGPRLASEAVELVVIWTRRYYWEHVSLLSVPLANGNGANVTDGLTVVNHNDGDAGHDNFVDIDGSDVAGVLPAPAYLSLRNTAGTAYWLRDVFVGHNAQSSPATFQAILEAEESLISGTNEATGTASNGFYRTVAWAGGQSDFQAFRWTLSGAQLALAGGNYFRVLARVVSGPSEGLFARLWLGYPASAPVSTLFGTDEVPLTDAPLQDLGVLALPPTPLPTPTDLALSLTLRAATGAALGLDFIQLTPMDSWRQIRQLGFQLAPNAAVVDDGSTQLTYAQGEGGDQLAVYSAFGKPVHLWPGVNQRLSFLWREITAMNISRTFSVQVRYRPRRLTL